MQSCSRKCGKFDCMYDSHNKWVITKLAQRLATELKSCQPSFSLSCAQSTGQSLDSIANPAVAQARISTVVNHTSSTTRVQGATPPAPVRTTVNTVPPTTTLQQPNTQVTSQHLYYIFLYNFFSCCIYPYNPRRL